MIIKQVLTPILISTIAIGLLTGCQTDSNNATGTPDMPDVANISESGFVYVAEFMPLPREIGEVNNLVCAGGKIYFTATSSGTEENPNLVFFNTGLYSVNLDGTELTQLICGTNTADNFLRTGKYEGISGMAVDSEGYIWIIKSQSSYEINLPADFDAGKDNLWVYADLIEHKYNATRLGSNGEELLNIPLDCEDISDVSRIDAFAVCGDADLYFYIGFTDIGTNDNTILGFDSNGQVLLRHEYESSYIRFLSASDNAVAFPIITNDNDEIKMSIQTLQPEENSAVIMGTGKEIPSGEWLPEEPDVKTYHVFAGHEGYSYYISNDEGLYSFSEDGSNIKKHLNWQELGIDAPAISNIDAMPDERVVCSLMVSDYSGYYTELAVLTKLLRSDVPQKTELTLAVLWELNWEYMEAVTKFNRYNSGYTLKVIEYEDIEQLALDLTTGNAPDILHIDIFMPYMDYIRSGLLEDLYPYIDADPELSRDDFVPPVLRESQIDGNLYSISPDFYIYTVIGNPAIVGNGLGWSIDEFEAVLNAHPDVEDPSGGYETQESFLVFAIRANIDSYIDMDTGTVNFETAEFIRLLELSERFPKEYFFSGEIQADKDIQIATGSLIGGLQRLLDDKIMLGGDIAFKGRPSDTGNNHEMRVDENCFAIIKTSENKDAAWLFLKMLMDEDWQYYNVSMFPSNQEAFSRRLANDMNDINRQGSFGANDETAQITQEDIDLLLAMIDSSAATFTVDMSLMSLIREEVTNYVNTINTAEETAKFLQDRVSLYVSERS